MLQDDFFKRKQKHNSEIHMHIHCKETILEIKASYLNQWMMSKNTFAYIISSTCSLLLLSGCIPDYFTSPIKSSGNRKNPTMCRKMQRRTVSDSNLNITHECPVVDAKGGKISLLVSVIL